MPGDMADERIRGRPVEDVVAVGAPGAAEPGIEVGGDLLHEVDGDLGREHPVEGPRQALRVEAGRVGVEGHDLAPGVHTAVGAARTAQRHGMAQDLRKGRFEVALHRAHVGVAGEPVEGATVVGDPHPHPDGAR